MRVTCGTQNMVAHHYLVDALAAAANAALECTSRSGQARQGRMDFAAQQKYEPVQISQ
jgi:hypothetical protein